MLLFDQLTHSSDVAVAARVQGARDQAQGQRWVAPTAASCGCPAGP